MHNSNNVSVLLIESNIELQNILKRILLQIPEIHINQVNSLRKAEKYTKEKHFDLLITNSNLKDGKGINFCENFRKKYPESPTKILVITKNNSLDTLTPYMEKGADYSLSLPIDPTHLILITKKYCGLINNRLRDNINKNGISLFSNEKYLMYKNLKIYLSDTEVLILQLLLQQNKKCKTESIAKYISTKRNKQISNEYIMVNIGRLRKKLKQHVGMTVIKNKYKEGYYIGV